MKNILVAFAVLSLILTGWLMASAVVPTCAAEAGESKTVVLRIDGMT